MTTYHFQVIGRQAKKNLPCPGCGTKVRRQTTLTNTLSPFNKDPQTGKVRTLEQIREHLRDLAALWEQEPVRCTPCADAAGATA